MHLPTHILSGWCVGNLLPLTARERLCCMAAATLPDIDGITYVLGEEMYWKTHKVIGHNLLSAVVSAALLAVLVSRPRRWAPLMLLYVALAHLHLLMDHYGSGPNWPTYYLWPFDRAFRIVNHDAWELLSWQNTTAAAVLIIWTIVIAIRQRRTPVELIAPRLDQEFVRRVRRGPANQPDAAASNDPSAT